jgi:hypothetical protein
MVRLLVLLVLVAGCGSSGSGVSPSQAAADCSAFVSGSYCPKIAGCFDVTQEYCVAAADSAIDCTKAVSEDGELATCETQIGNSPCSVLVASDGTVTLPASCKDVFQLSQ